MAGAERTTKWRRAHPEQAAAAQRKWRAANPDKVKAQKARHQKTPEERANTNERARQWRLAHVERSRASGRAWAAKHPDRALDAYLRRCYGISLADYQAILAQQGGVCAICKGPQQAHRTRLSVDHDHVTGQIRGLLCDNCNTGIGKLQNNTTVLQKAIEYLERSIG